MRGDDADEPVELLASSSDRTSVEERLHGVARGGGGVARRHPWWAAVLVVVLVGGVAAGVYLVRRPPPMSTTIDVTVASSGGDGQYLVELHSPGEELNVVGIVGPGLADPRSTIGRVTANGPGLGHLDAVIDCSGGWEQGRPVDYRVRVLHTDDRGREATYDVPFDRDQDWWSLVQITCSSQH
jgi:hypothetical protein